MVKSGFYYVEGRKLYASDFDLNWIDKYLGNPEDVQVIFEFGSFDCGDGYRFKKHCKNSKVFSIEACPKRFEIIENFAKNEGILPFHCAISDVDGEIDFYQCLDPNEGDLRYGPAGSVLERTNKHKNNWSHLSYPDPIKVKSYTLDTFCKEQGVENIDLLYMDIEGAELKALRGLTFCNPRMVYVECHLDKDYYGEKAYDTEEMHLYMIERGYELKEKTETDRLYTIEKRNPINESTIS